ncbi:hypothetical protein ACOJQI_21315 [Bacillus salacetis]|uniref:hypothetical protein n=1 Tax=Bacillus salacetis TaxID=2315464 RepID=UPI003B9EC287
MLTILRILFALTALALGITGLLTDTLAILPYMFLALAFMLVTMAATEFKTKRNRLAVLFVLASMACFYNSLIEFIR